MQARYVAALLGCASLLCAAAGRGAEAVPFYMYSGPAYDWVKNCSVNYRSELDALRHAFHAGEILFQEQLAHHPERAHRVPGSETALQCRAGCVLQTGQDRAAVCRGEAAPVQVCLTMAGSARGCLWCPRSSCLPRAGPRAAAAAA